MGLRIQLRANADIFFPKWADYLGTRGGLESDVSLCRVLNENTALLRERVSWSASNRVENAKKARKAARDRKEDTTELDEQLDRRQKELQAVKQRAAFPWITPVLGSGCTSDHVGASDLADLPAQLAVAARQWGPVFPGGEEAEDLVLRFSTNLVRSRTLRSQQVPFPVSDGHDSSPADSAPLIDAALAARAAIVAALLTRLFHRTSALANQPIWDSREEVQLASHHQESGNIQEHIVEPLLVHLQEFANLVDQHPELGFFVEHLNRISDKVGRDGVVTMDYAELLTEITWHLMARGTDRYTGWTDLLLLIGIRSRTRRPDRRVPRLTNLGDPDGLRAWLIEGLQATTEKSWRSRRVGDIPTNREGFYDVIASLLTRQAILDETHKNDPPSRQFPPAVAYVTSFDLELEMALHAKGTTFVLVAPFEVWRGAGEHRRASLVWFYRIVPEVLDEDERSLRQISDAGDWRILLEDAMKDTDTPLAGKPVVVRLTGCPLVELPYLDSDPTTEQILESLVFPNEAKPSSNNEKSAEQYPVAHAAEFEVGHAALLDEYTGLHHWTAEARDELRLPRELVGNRSEPHVTENMDRRFWLLLGVQIPDDAVRHRVAALVAAESIRGLVPNADYETPRAGVVVNRRSEPAQRDILQWQGLDVVEDDHTAVLNALRHYMRHLEDGVNRPVGNAGCKLGLNDALRKENQ